MTFPGFREALSVLDTTLRDGDQSPGGAFTPREKMELARLLDEIGVDVIEAGFPTSSPVDFESCRLVASAGLRARVAVMTRCRIADIEKTSRVFPSSTSRDARMLHLSLPVSGAHMHKKLGKDPDEILRIADECIRLASSLAGFVEIGAEDATRADREFLAEYCAAAIAAGATHVNVADTVGVANPTGFAELIRFLVSRVPEFADGRATLSVHCHNDLGLATANTLAAIGAGATQIETTIAGIGERAGNACFEEVVANLLFAGGETFVGDSSAPQSKAFSRLGGLSRALSSMRSIDYVRGRPVIDGSARSHASGIHQNGILINSSLYNPVSVKLAESGAMASGERLVISRHSGRDGLAHAISLCTGLIPPEEIVSSVLQSIKKESPVNPFVGTTELLALLADVSFVPKQPLRCFNIEETQRDGKYSVRAEIGRSRDFAVLVSGQGDSLLSALLVAVKGVFPASIIIKTFASSCYTEDSGAVATLFRVSLEAYTDQDSRRYYAIERLGFGLSRVCLDCFLDIVNSEHEKSRNVQVF